MDPIDPIDPIDLTVPQRTRIFERIGQGIGLSVIPDFVLPSGMVVEVTGNPIVGEYDHVTTKFIPIKAYAPPRIIVGYLRLDDYPLKIQQEILSQVS